MSRSIAARNAANVLPDPVGAGAASIFPPESEASPSPGRGWAPRRPPRTIPGRENETRQADRATSRKNSSVRNRESGLERRGRSAGPNPDEDHGNQRSDRDAPAQCADRNRPESQVYFRA